MSQPRGESRAMPVCSFACGLMFEQCEEKLYVDQSAGPKEREEENVTALRPEQVDDGVEKKNGQTLPVCIRVR